MHTQRIKNNTLVLLEGEQESGRLIRLGWLSQRTRLERPGTVPWALEPGGRWYQTRFIIREENVEIGVIAKKFGQCAITVGNEPPRRLVMDGWWADRYRLLDQDDQCVLHLKARMNWSGWGSRFDLNCPAEEGCPEPYWCLLALFAANLLHESTQLSMG